MDVRRSARIVAPRTPLSGAKIKQTGSLCATHAACTTPKMTTTDPRYVLKREACTAQNDHLTPKLCINACGLYYAKNDHHRPKVRIKA